MRAVISLVCYGWLAILSVLTPWLVSLGKDGFNRLVRNPWADPYELVSVGLSLSGVVFTTVKSLMNRDWPEEKA